MEHPVEAMINIANDVFQLSNERTMNAINYLTSCGHGNNAFGIAQALTHVCKDLNGEQRWNVESKVTGLKYGAYDKQASSKIKQQLFN